MAGFNLPQWYVWVLSIALPALDALIINTKWNRQIKSLVALLVAIAAGFIATWVTGQLNWQNLLVTITVVFSISQVVYDQFFKNVLQKKDKNKVANF